MCTGIFMHQLHRSLVFLLAFNRDEHFDRPTAAVDWWTANGVQLLAGRDQVGGGTWLGVTRAGRVAFLTNFREEYQQKPGSLTRGNLTVNFLTGTSTPIEYLRGLECGAYNGFNIVVGDLRTSQMAYLNNVDCEPRHLDPGLHGAANGDLNDSKWQKLLIGKRGMQQMLQTGALEGEILSTLSQT